MDRWGKDHSTVVKDPPLPSRWITRCSGRVKPSLGIVSFCYANPAQPATSLLWYIVRITIDTGRLPITKLCELCNHNCYGVTLPCVRSGNPISLTMALASSLMLGIPKMLYSAPFTYGRISVLSWPRRSQRTLSTSRGSRAHRCLPEIMGQVQ